MVIFPSKFHVLRCNLQPLVVNKGLKKWFSPQLSQGFLGPPPQTQLEPHQLHLFEFFAISKIAIKPQSQLQLKFKTLFTILYHYHGIQKEKKERIIVKRKFHQKSKGQ